MRIAVIGSGNVGSGLATVLSKAGFEVIIGARDVAKTTDIAKGLGPNISVATVKEAADKARPDATRAVPVHGVARALRAFALQLVPSPHPPV